MRRLVLLSVTGLVFLAFGTPARGDLILFDNRAAFDAATTGRSVIDFEGIAPDEGFQFLPAPPGITLSGVNFTIDRATSNGNLFVIGDNFYYTTNSVLSSSESRLAPISDNVLITLPGAFTAIAVDFGSFLAGRPVTFTPSTGDAFTRTTPSFPNLAFVGVVSDAPITSLTISKPSVVGVDTVLNLDNFTFGQAVSEPSTFALASVGVLTALGFWLRRRSCSGSSGACKC